MRPLMATLLNAIGAAFGPLPTLPSCWYDAEQCLQSMPWKERQMNGCFTFECSYSRNSEVYSCQSIVGVT